MKKALSILTVVIAAMFIVGCAGLHLNSNENIALKSAARIAGYKIAQNNTELAAQALPYAKALLATEDSAKLTNSLWPAAVKLIQEKINDPLIAASIVDVLSLVQVDAGTMDINAGNIKITLAAFIEGIELATKSELQAASDWAVKETDRTVKQ